MSTRAGNISRSTKPDERGIRELLPNRVRSRLRAESDEAPNASSISLTTDDARLVAAFSDGVRQFRTTDNEEIGTIEGEFALVNAATHAIPGENRVLVQNKGTGLTSTSQVFDLNDRTVEGLKNDSQGYFSVQYHPEASPGPHDSHYLFQSFTELIQQHHV